MNAFVYSLQAVSESCQTSVAIVMLGIIICNIYGILAPLVWTSWAFMVLMTGHSFIQACKAYWMFVEASERSVLQAVAFAFVEPNVYDPRIIIHDVCPICLFPGTHRNFRETPCRHLFHVNCLVQWMTLGNRQCPLCRSNLFTVDPSDI